MQLFKDLKARILQSIITWLVSFAAVIRVVTLRSSPLTSGGEALRDDYNSGCGGDYYVV